MHPLGLLGYRRVVMFKIERGRNPFINPVLWGNNDSTGGGKILRDCDSQGLLINALFNCLCIQSVSLLPGLHLCCSYVQWDDEKLAFLSNACYYVVAREFDEFSFSISLCFPFPSSLSSWSIFMTCLSLYSLTLIQLVFLLLALSSSLFIRLLFVFVSAVVLS